MGKTKILLRKMRQVIFGSEKLVMTEPLTTADFQSLTTEEDVDRYHQEQAILTERIEKDILDDDLRRKMHQDLIDTYDEELENEIDDYTRDFRFNGREMSEQEKLDRRTYFQELVRLQRELIKLQDWVVDRGERIVVIFEGRDSAGKGGAIKRITQRLNPRVCRVAALPAPTEREQTQWYFQRYVAHLPAAGEIVLFDRSWYNRGGVERVMGFCTDAQYEEFFQSVPEFERMLVRSGIRLVKYWFSITDDEQHARFMSRIYDPLKQWKLSPMDLQSRRRWEDYTKAKETMFERTHIPEAPWWVVEGNNKKRARLNCIAHLLDQIPYKEVPRDEIELPNRKRDDEYYREPIPDDMYVPPRY
ncbi:polyphosphate kinase 2 [Psychrobacter immobilis]|uniref:polyphosphate kinase 2 n=1 Tax=Psychrobacter immobilis TaxID=498 RepID=UPI002233F38B|nr:polyphosphate kinase 2 [Psychrobacter immobilis]